MIAEIGYVATMGAHDPADLARDLIAVIAVPALLAPRAPAVFTRSAVATG